MHGEMIARGCDSTDEILRTVAAVVGVKFEPKTVPGIGVAVAVAAHAKQPRLSDQEVFEGNAT